MSRMPAMSTRTRRPDRRHRTAGHYRRALADIGYQIVIDSRWLGMLDIDCYVTLTSTVYLAAGGGHVYPIRHFAILELVDQFIHHRFHHTRGIGARNIAMQPALGMRDHSQGVCGSADDKACFFQRFDQRFNPRFVIEEIFNVGADGKSQMPIGKRVTDVTKLAQRIDIQYSLGTRFNRPYLLTTLRCMSEHARSWMVMPLPLSEVA